MIDTIKLTFSKNMFQVTDIGKFVKGVQEGSRGYFKLVQNPTKTELKSGLYKPRLTLTKRYNTTGKFEPTLLVEFSIPKLIYGNNFYELDDTDFELVIDKLQASLKTMGILVFRELLNQAPVSAIHYSKNLVFTDGTTSHYLISKLKQSDTSIRLDTEQTKYKNEGTGYKWHTNSFELAFYDKLEDLRLSRISDKRAYEKDNMIQLGLYDKLIKVPKLQILRIEARLGRRYEIHKILEKISHQSDLTFQDLFKSKLSKCILLHYLTKLESNRSSINDTTTGEHLLSEIVINNPNLTPRGVFQILGLKQALTSLSPRDLKKSIPKKSAQKFTKTPRGCQQNQYSFRQEPALNY